MKTPSIYRLLFELYENGKIAFHGESFTLHWSAWIDIAVELLETDPDALEYINEHHGSLELWLDESAAMELLRLHRKLNEKAVILKTISPCAFVRSTLRMH